MAEFIAAISAPHNMLLTFALGACALYWLFVVVFGVGSEMFHGAAGLFQGGDAGGHEGLDTHFDGHATPTVAGSALRFLNFGEVPATIILSVILLFTWTISVITHRYTNEFSFPIQALIFAGVVIASLFLSKLITSPLKESFAKGDGKGPVKTNLIGSECLLTTSIGETRSGTAEAKTDSARFIIVHVRAAPGQGDLPKGARATIVSVDPTAGGYLVRLPGSTATPTEGGNSK